LLAVLRALHYVFFLILFFTRSLFRPVLWTRVITDFFFSRLFSYTQTVYNDYFQLNNNYIAVIFHILIIRQWWWCPRKTAWYANSYWNTIFYIVITHYYGRDYTMRMWMIWYLRAHILQCKWWIPPVIIRFTSLQGRGRRKNMFFLCCVLLFITT
jgi:hypothetical protein